MSQAEAKVQLTNINTRLRNEIRQAQQENGLLKAKLENQQRFEKEVVELRDLAKDLQQQKSNLLTRNKSLLEKVEGLEEQLKKERNERELKQSEDEEKLKCREATIENLKKAAEFVSKQLDDQRKQMKERERQQEESAARVTLHLECKNGRIERRFLEEEDGEATIMCFSNEAAAAHCHHVTLVGKEMRMKVKNTRWPSKKCKLKRIFSHRLIIHYIIFFIESLSLETRTRSRRQGISTHSYIQHMNIT